jgi:hypothetical protein
VSSSDRSRASDVASIVARALGKLVLRVPRSDRPPSDDPRAKARRLAHAASRKAGAISTGMALPPGPLGMLTIVPDLVAMWRLQSQLVSDIAAVYGRSASLTRESLLYCLFKHGSAALLRDVVARAGDRYLVRRSSVKALQRLLTKIGVRVTDQVLGRALSRWVPVLGALGVGAYAYYDTAKVAANAIELFSREVVVEP